MDDKVGRQSCGVFRSWFDAAVEVRVAESPDRFPTAWARADVALAVATAIQPTEAPGEVSPNEREAWAFLAALRRD